MESSSVLWIGHLTGLQPQSSFLTVQQRLLHLPELTLNTLARQGL
jgi:hypothetical protein